MTKLIEKQILDQIEIKGMEYDEKHDVATVIEVLEHLVTTIALVAYPKEYYLAIDRLLAHQATLTK